MDKLFDTVLELSWQAGLIALAVMAVRLGPVSYKHLPAHGAGRKLVWRLLLGKKKRSDREGVTH